MKLIFCESCAGLVVPSRIPFEPRFCDCQQSACWWIEPCTGKFAVYNRLNADCVSVIGLHNGLLTSEFPVKPNGFRDGMIPRETMDAILAETEPYYIFKRINSLVIRIRPGFSSDVQFVQELPPNKPQLCDTTPPANE